MNEILKQLTERKSVRVFEEKPISKEDKTAILQAAMEAPTAGNQQLYTILDITDTQLKAQLSETCDHQPFIAKAPMVLIFCADCCKWFDAYEEAGCAPRKPGAGDLMLAVSDAVIAAQNVVTAAWSLGIGSCYIGDIMEQCETHRKILHLPEYVFPAAMLVFGYPTKQQKLRTKPKRFALKDIVSENQYQRKSGEELRTMFEKECSRQDYDTWIEKFCNRKYNSDFSREMTRSVGVYLKEYGSMNYSIFFSPTGGTQKVVRHVGESFLDITDIDISMKISDYTMTKEDFCIVGVPSFGGRVPDVAAKRLRQMHGSQTPALLIVTYGNRAYEDALKELKDILEAQGFVCIGAMAVVTEHSIVPQIGAGRPTKEDYEEIDTFLIKIKERLQGEPHTVEVPGSMPYKEYHVVPMQIQVSEQCTSCGLCAKRCPVHAIPPEAPQTTEHETCISCMRCVRICPFAARRCDEAKRKMIADRLQQICVPGRKNEFF